MAVFKEHTIVAKWKALWSKVGYNIASFSVGTQLLAKLDIFHLSRRSNEINILSIWFPCLQVFRGLRGIDTEVGPP